MPAEIEDLVHEESVDRRLERHGYNRLLLLADAVFAIAITLAALEIKPHGRWRTDAELWRALQLPLLSYAVSFAVISFYWLAHRDTFARVRRVDGGLTALALAQLLFIAVLPSATQLLYDEEARLQAVRVYAAATAAVGFANAALWAYAAFRPGLMARGHSAAYRLGRLGVALIMPLYFLWLAAVGATAIGPQAIYGAFAATAVLAVLRLGVLPRLRPDRP